jgi:site-specific DNA recombinase
MSPTQVTKKRVLLTMAQSPISATIEPGDPRFSLTPAELVEAVAAGRLSLGLETYPDADTAIYARISLDRRDRTSVERQLEIGIAYAQEQRLSFVVFLDRGKSAYRKGVFRPGYGAALDAIRARRIRRLIAYKVDRIYRQVEELMDVIKLADGGRVPITLIGVDDDERFDLTTGKGCDQAIGRVLEAQKESRRISERVRTERRKAREKGIPGPGPSAFGWRDKMHHDEMQAEALRQAYASILHGSSLRALVVRWNAAGMPTARGAQWAISEVKKVLMNQRNVGRLTHTYAAFDDNGQKRSITEIVRDDAFEPIVDRDTFDAVQRVLAERSLPRRHPRRRSMLTGLVRCSPCNGGVMNRNQVAGRPVYRCSNGRGHHIGCGITINADHLQAFVEDALYKYVDSSEFQRRVAERRETGTRRDELIEERDRLANKRTVLRRAMLTSRRDDDLDGYQQDVQEIGDALQRVDEELAMVRPVNPAVEWAGNSGGLRESWKRFDDDEKREIIKDAFGSVTISRATRRGRGFDPARVELGMNIAVQAEIERLAGLDDS